MTKPITSVSGNHTQNSARTMMTPEEAITADPPNVWLTNFYGFNPDKWGFLGFTSTGQRDHFIKNTVPGVLVVIYGHKTKAREDQQGQIIGIQQMSHRVNFAKTFMDPTEWVVKEADPQSKGKWDYAVKAERAWKVAPEAYQLVDDFADESYTIGRSQTIGSYGVRLTPAEVKKLENLVLIETTVFGEIAIDDALPVLGRELLLPSKPGPVSQQGYYIREAEGPKQNYILKLNGSENDFLGYFANGQSIVKVGMSVSPLNRKDALNAALPAGAYSWFLMYSNEADSFEPYANSKLGLIGENVLKTVLTEKGKSLGGEFFLASDTVIAEAWAASKRKVQEYSSVF